MKKLILFPLLILSFSLIAQIPGKKSDDPVKIGEIEIKTGDILNLGRGSDPRTGDFVFIYQPPNYIAGIEEIKLDKMYAGSEIEIKHFKIYSRKKIGEKTFAVINIGGLNNAIELEAAINAGEIVAINGKPVGDHDQGDQSSVSVADELIKLKELLDQGVITKEEFESQKAKLLGN